MAPKAKITKEMIADAAFEIVREKGADKLTARTISEQLSCSTQPVLYYFDSVEDIRKAAYAKADAYHAAYIMGGERDYGNPMLTMGMNYIRFAREESNLFRFLFQTNELSGVSLLDLMETEEMLPLFAVLQNELSISAEAAKNVFRTLFIFVHGYAALYANNAMLYDETSMIEALEKVFVGAVYAAKGEEI